MARGTNGKVSTTVKRLLAIEGRLEAMTEHLAAQGQTLTAIKTLLEETLTLRPRIEALEGQRGLDKETLEELIHAFWREGRLALATLATRAG